MKNTDKRNVAEFKRGARTPVEERILTTARELFYQEGIRASGVDTITERAGVAKTSLYRWWPTKDALIEAFLREENAAFWAHWDKVAAEHAGGPAIDELRAHVAWIADYVAGPKFRGCPFLNATAEFPESQHPARAVCRLNKAELKRRLGVLAERAGAEEPDLVADQLVLLIDGSFANSQVLGKTGPCRALVSAAEALFRTMPSPKID